MKKILNYIIVALAGISLLACNTKQTPEEITPSVGEYTYTIAITGDTKAVLSGDYMAWETGDVIGWYTDKPGNSTINMGTDPRSFNVTSEAAMASGSTIYAYAPYTAAATGANAELSIPASQNGSNIKDAMPMVSLPIVLATDTPADINSTGGEACFVNLGSVIEYNVYTTNATYASEKIQSVKFASSSNIAGDFTIDLIQVVSASSLPAITGLSENTVTSTLASATTVGGSKDAGIKVYQVVAPGTWSGTITVTTDVATYDYTVTGKEFSRGSIKPINVDLASDHATRLTAKEKILVGSKWKLVNYWDSWSWKTSVPTNESYNVLNDDYNGTFPARLGNPRLLFYSNHSFALENYGYFNDCASNPQNLDPTDANGQWSLTSSESILHFANGAFPIVLVSGNDKVSVDWTIVSLTSAQLHIYAWDDYAGQWANLVFEPDGINDTPVPPTVYIYDHTFDTGDFGLNDENIWSSPLTATLDGKSWTLENNQGAYMINTPWAWAGTVIWNGWGWEYEPTVVTLTSSSFAGTISAVSLDFSIGQNWEITANCSVGGAAFGSVDQVFTNTDGEHPQQTATFTGSASGTIVITVTQAADTGCPIMLRGVHVTYSPD